jgi:2-iminobutanoate/2-iminopropanoate deaminase
VRTVITASANSPLGGYSQAMIDGELVYLSSCTAPADPETGEVPETIAGQTEGAIRNVERVLEAAGTSLDRVVKVTVYLADATQFPEFDEAYRGLMPEPRPARTTVGASLAHVPGSLIAIDAIASLRDDR